MLKLSEQGDLATGGHGDAGTLYLLERVLAILGPLASGGFVDVAVSSATHLAALEKKEVLDAGALLGAVDLELVVHDWLEGGCSVEQ